MWAGILVTDVVTDLFISDWWGELSRVSIAWIGLKDGMLESFEARICEDEFRVGWGVEDGWLDCSGLVERFRRRFGSIILVRFFAVNVMVIYIYIYEDTED